MIDETKLDAEFVQTGNSCVLASYAVVGNYFTGAEIPRFFEGIARTLACRIGRGKLNGNMRSIRQGVEEKGVQGIRSHRRFAQQFKRNDLRLVPLEILCKVLSRHQ